MGLSLNNPWVVSAITAGWVLFLLTWYAYRSRLRLHDASNERSLHQGVALTGAGIFMFVPLCLFVAWQYPLFVPLYFVLLLTVIGGFDDRYDLSARLRLFFQLLIAAGLLLYLNLSVHWVLLVFLLLSLLWWLNLFNFMDGANGLVGFHAVVAVGFYTWLLFDAFEQASVLHVLALTTIAVMLVYLLFNVVLKKLFMGDSGSLPLAMIIAVLALYLIIYDQINYFEVALIHAVFIVDATATLFYRFAKGEPVSQAHATHLYQRLIKTGWSHTRVALLYALLTLLCCCLVWKMPQLRMPDYSVVLMVYAVFFIIFMKTLRLGR